MKFRHAVLLILALVFLFPGFAEAQCAMCKESAESTLKNDPSSIARGLNSGILYLMAVPYLAIMFIFRKQIYQLFRKFTARFSKA